MGGATAHRAVGILGSLGDYSGASAAAKDATLRGPNNWTAWLALAQASHEASQDVTAQSALRHAVALNPALLKFHCERKCPDAPPIALP
jgi:Flp pilus assembly protein TadD